MKSIELSPTGTHFHYFNVREFITVLPPEVPEHPLSSHTQRPHIMSPFSKFNGAEPKYDSLEEARLMDDNASSDSDQPLHRGRSRVDRLGILIPWTLSAVLLVLLGASWTFKWSNECGSSSFERGFSTELGKA